MILRTGQRKTPTFWLVLHLSFCDLSLLLHGVIFARNSSNSGLNFSNNFQCGYLQSSTQFFMTLSMYSIVAIAAHRCYGLITPGAANFDAKRNAFLFSLAWIISFAITIPVFMKSKVHQNRNEKLCSVVYESSHIYNCFYLIHSIFYYPFRKLANVVLKNIVSSTGFNLFFNF